MTANIRTLYYSTVPRDTNQPIKSQYEISNLRVNFLETENPALFHTTIVPAQFQLQGPPSLEKLPVAGHHLEDGVLLNVRSEVENNNQVRSEFKL